MLTYLANNNGHSQQTRAFTIKTELTVPFLLLARYVSNVAKRSVWDQCKKYMLKTDRPNGHRRPTNDRPTTNRLLIWPIFGKIQMTISPLASSDPLHVWFMVGFSGLADRIALFPVWPNPRWRLGRHLENSNGDISVADHPIYSVFGSRMGFSGSADRMALFSVWPNSIGMWEKQRMGSI